MIPPAQALVLALLACFAGAAASGLVARRRALAGWLACAATALSSGLALWAALRVLAAGVPAKGVFWQAHSLGFALRIQVDGLTAVFLVLIALVAPAAALFSIPYLEQHPTESVGRYYPNFLIFLAAMYGLVSTADMMWFFFIFWQMMTLPGYALIRFERGKPANVRAANKYLVMMQIACALTMIGAEILVAGGGRAGDLKYDFDTVSQNLPALLRSHPGLVATAFGLFLAGFGIKLGMWPFGQVWLPDAHPAAPSPVSALLSGVMIKTGIYGLMRYFFWLVPAEAQADFPMARWGAALAVLGTFTLFTGTMQALKQEQTKRLLAFHSIGQAGYIVLGLGIALALLPASDWALASLAAVGFVGALFHTLNHGLFKSLLFLNSGALLRATGTQDLNQMGGLLRLMPWTALTALIASLSIAGVPLCNGYASKWCLAVAGFQGGALAPYLPVCALIALLTSVLTLASFLKFFGASFLARTSALVREKAAGRASLEVGWLMRGPQLFLAGLCLLLGLVPAVGFHLMGLALHGSQQGLGGVLAQALSVRNDFSLGACRLSGQALYVPAALVVVLGLLFLLSLAISRLGEARRRRAVPWLCGYALESGPLRFTAHAYYGEIKRHFRWLGGNPGVPKEPLPPLARPVSH